jgi:hypothetical protein
MPQFSIGDSVSQDDEDVLGWNAFGPQVPDDRLVEPTFRVRRSTRERRDLDERVVLAGSRRNLEALCLVLDDALRPVVVRDAEALNQGSVYRVEETLLLVSGSALQDLDPNQRHLGWPPV